MDDPFQPVCHFRAIVGFNMGGKQSASVVVIIVQPVYTRIDDPGHVL